MNDLSTSDVKTELLLAKGKHLLFKSRLRAYASDPTKVPEELLVNHMACDLGKWIEKVKGKFGQVQSLAHLDLVHQSIHQIARELVSCKKAHNEVGVSEKLKQAEGVMKQVLKGIEAIEDEIHQLK